MDQHSTLPDLSDFLRGSKKYIARPLYPLRDAARDHRHVMKKMVDFLATYGYWPAKPELCDFMKADLAGLVYCLENLTKIGLLFKEQRRAARPYYQLSPRGWQALGLQPVEPWIKRPKRLESRIAHEITLNLANLEDAQRELDERHGTKLLRDGRETWRKTKYFIDKDE